MILDSSANMFDADDREFMRKALALAEEANGLASPNPTVGCVIVRDGNIVGRGWHEYALLDHAEVRALREASENSRNATAYVTLEPCCQRGRTSPCVEKLIEAGIRRVVAARIDPNPKVSGRGIDLLRSAGVQVDVGLFSDAAGKLIESFACHIATGLPLVISKVGMSLDGKIGISGSRRQSITSPEGRQFGQALRHEADAILVGVGTVLTDNPELTYRGTARRARPLIRIILDTNLRTPADARLFQATPPSPILVFCRDGICQDKRERLIDRGAEIVTVDCSQGELGLPRILAELAKRDILGLLVEGGSRIHWSFLSERLVDKFYFIIAPFVLGGENSIPSVGGKGYGDAAASPRFRVRSSFSMGPDMVLETYPSYSRSIISPWLSPEDTASAARDLQPS